MKKRQKWQFILLKWFHALIIILFFLEKSFDVDPSVIVVEEGATSLPLHFASVDPNSKLALFKHFAEDLIPITA